MVISPSTNTDDVFGGAFTKNDFATFGSFAIEFTSFGSVRPTYTLRSVHLGGKSESFDWAVGICFSILAVLEIAFIAQIALCHAISRKKVAAKLVARDAIFVAEKADRRRALQEKHEAEDLLKLSMKQLTEIAAREKNGDDIWIPDEAGDELHRDADLDENGDEDDHARKNKRVRNWIPTIIADVGFCLLLFASMIAGARVDEVSVGMELPDPNIDDEPAAYAFGAQLASYDVAWSYFSWTLSLSCFWGWVAQIYHLTVRTCASAAAVSLINVSLRVASAARSPLVRCLRLIAQVFFPAFGVPCTTLVKRGGDMVVAIAMISILVCAIMSTFLFVLGNFDYSFNDPRALLLYSIRAVMGDFDFDVFEGSQWRHTAPIFIACYSVIIVYVLMSIFVAILSEAFADVTEQRLVDSQTETAKVLDSELRAEMRLEVEAQLRREQKEARDAASQDAAAGGVNTSAAEASAADANAVDADEAGADAANSGGNAGFGWGALAIVAKIAAGKGIGGAVRANAAIEDERQKRQLRMLTRADKATRMLKGGGELTARELMEAKMNGRFQMLEEKFDTFQQSVSDGIAMRIEGLEGRLLAALASPAGSGGPVSTPRALPPLSNGVKC